MDLRLSFTEFGNGVNRNAKNPNFFGIFCFFDGDDTNSNAAFRFGIVNDEEKDSTKIRWNAGFNDDISDFSASKKNAHNIGYDLKNINCDLDGGAYITVTLDPATTKHYDTKTPAKNQMRTRIHS